MLVRKSKKYTIEEFLSQVDITSQNKKKTSKDFDGDQIYAGSLRYQLFKLKGTKCVKCGLEGQYFVKERWETDNRYHLNLYGIDKNDNEILFTKDHIVPKSKGGTNTLDNFQVMCEKCNSEKGIELSLEINELINKDYIGKQVQKKSGKPFKSKLKINTIKGVVKHPVLKDENAFIFDEDDSIVSIYQCEVLN